MLNWHRKHFLCDLNHFGETQEIGGVISAAFPELDAKLR